MARLQRFRSRFYSRSFEDLDTHYLWEPDDGGSPFFRDERISLADDDSDSSPRVFLSLQDRMAARGHYFGKIGDAVDPDSSPIMLTSLEDRMRERGIFYDNSPDVIPNEPEGEPPPLPWNKNK